MSKAKFTEADVKRAVKGVIDGGGSVASVDIWPDGRISITVKEDKHRSLDPEDDPAVSRKLLWDVDVPPSRCPAIRFTSGLKTAGAIFLTSQAGRASEVVHCRMNRWVLTTTGRFSGWREFCSRRLIAGAAAARTRPLLSAWSSEPWTGCFTNIAERGHKKPLSDYKPWARVNAACTRPA